MNTGEKKLDTTARTILQSDISLYSDSVHFGLSAILHDISERMYDTIPEDLSDTLSISLEDTVNYWDSIVTRKLDHTLLRAWLDSVPHVSAAYSVADDWLMLMQYDSAIAVMDSIPFRFELSTPETTEHSKRREMVQLLKDLHDNEKEISEIDSSGIAMLTTVAEEISVSSSIAQNILRNYYGKEYETYPSFQLPSGKKEWEPNSPKKTKTETEPEPSGFMIFPNPAKDYVTFRLDNMELLTGTTLIVSDALGRNLYKISFSDTIHEKTVSLTGWSSGMYVCLLKMANGKRQQGKFFISR